MPSLVRFPARGYTPPVVEPKRLLTTEKKGLSVSPSVTVYPPELFWDSQLNSPSDYNSPPIRGFNAYALSTLAYSCIRYRSTKLVEAPLWIAEEIDGAETFIDGDHPLAELLERPNPDMEMADLLECVSTYLDITGKALLVKNRDNAGRVRSLYPFSGYDFTVGMQDGRLYGNFRVRTTLGEQDYKPEDVVFFRNLDPRFQHQGSTQGLSPLDVALHHVNIGHEMRQAVSALLRNQIRPGSVTTYPNVMDEDEFKRAKAEFQTNLQGYYNAGKNITLEGGATIDFRDSDMKNLALGEVEQDVEAAICSCFQVHPAVVGAKIGIIGNRGLADTIKPAAKLFYDLFAFPTWSRLEKTLTRSLLREVDDNPLRFIRFDKTKVRELQEDVGARTAEASAATGYWTRDEQRTHTGQAPLPEGDPRGAEIVEKQPAPTGATVATGASGTPAKALKVSENAGEYQRPVDSKASDPASIATETKADMRARLWRKADVKASRQERPYETAAEEQFAKEKSEVSKIVEDAKNPATAVERIAQAYAYKASKYHKEWHARFLDLIAQSVDVGGSDLAAETGFDFNLANPKVQTAIQNRANKLSGNVTETTYQKLRDEIAAGREAGESTSQLAKRIRENVFGGEITKARATLIARTETVGGLNTGEFLGALESGILLSKEWLTQGDKKVRDSHAEQDGLRIPINDDFPNGVLYPGDQRGAAEEIINERCTLLYHDEAIT